MRTLNIFQNGSLLDQIDMSWFTAIVTWLLIAGEKGLSIYKFEKRETRFEKNGGLVKIIGVKKRTRLSGGILCTRVKRDDKSITL